MCVLSSPASIFEQPLPSSKCNSHLIYSSVYMCSQWLQPLWTSPFFIIYCVWSKFRIGSTQLNFGSHPVYTAESWTHLNLRLLLIVTTYFRPSVQCLLAVLCVLSISSLTVKHCVLVTAVVMFNPFLAHLCITLLMTAHVSGLSWGQLLYCL